MQFDLEVIVTPKEATLKVDGEAVTLTDGKYSSKEDFEKKLSLKVELDGYETKEVAHIMSSTPSENIVKIDVSKKEV